MADTIPQTTDSPTPRNAGDGSLRAGGSRQWRAVAWTAIFVVVATSAHFARQYSRGCAIERRLTGTWVTDFIREDGTVDPFIWQFLPDGTMRHHPEGKPFAETGSVDDYMWWRVSDGLLVLTYDRRFRQDATLKSKAKTTIRYLQALATGKNFPLARYDRCIIRDSGGDSIELTLHANENTRDSWVGGRTHVLTRTSDGIAIQALTS